MMTMHTAPPPSTAQTALSTGSQDAAESVIAALRTVYDPEIPVNVYDLGLIYRSLIRVAARSRST